MLDSNDFVKKKKLAEIVMFKIHVLYFGLNKLSIAGDVKFRIKWIIGSQDQYYY